MASQAAWNKGFIGSLVALGVFVAIVLAAFGLQNTAPAHPEAVPSPSVTATATPSATPIPTPSPTANCDARFVQEPDSHGDDGKVDAGFTDAYNKATAGKTGADLSVAQRDVLLQRAGVNAKRLASWSYANGIWPDPNKWKELVSADGKCLSQDGIMLWSKLEGALTGNGTKFDEGKAPAGGYNSGNDGDTFVVSPEPGVIEGQRKAIIITFKNGTKVYILVYCGNVVFPAPPANVPTSPKVPHPTPQVPVTPLVPNVPQTPICELMPTLPQCLTPKSRNIQDYQRPGTDNTTDSGTGVKPPVTADPTPDKAPPPVVTSQTGGGGVVDNSSNKPGSQTGGTAPGATTPEPSRSSPPAPEPGVNNPATGDNTGTIANPFGG